MMMIDAASSLYIHVPYCVSKCAYCDFNSRGPSSGSCHNPGDLQAYADAVVREIAMRAESGESGHKGLDTCFLGGGTPTILGDAQLTAIIDGVRDSFGLLPGYELTVEANPGTLSPSRLDNLLRAGVNRLSIGIQSFDEGELRMLGRIHSPGMAAFTVGQAHASGFDNINIDLMFGLPGQTMASWEDTLKRGVDLGPEHVSAYCLKVEEGTALEKALGSGALPPIDEDLAADMMEATIAFLRRNGYNHYEISNHAKPGMECRHNLTYWRYRPYIGVGAGAVGFNGTQRYTNAPDDRVYTGMVNEGNLPVDGVENLDTDDTLAESCIMGLRLLEGLDTRAWEARFGRPLRDVFGGPVDDLVGRGLLEWNGHMLGLTDRGLMVGNLVFSGFLDPSA